MEFVDPIRSQKQIDNMKRFLKERKLRDWLLFTIGINSGLRISDLLQLTVEDVKGKDRISIREQKTGKLKDFPLSDNSKRAIAEYIKSEHLENGPLFPSRKANGSLGSGAISRQQAYQREDEQGPKNNGVIAVDRRLKAHKPQPIQRENHLNQ